MRTPLNRIIHSESESFASSLQKQTIQVGFQSHQLKERIQQQKFMTVINNRHIKTTNLFMIFCSVIQSKEICVFRDVIFYENVFPYQRVQDTSNETISPNIYDQILFTRDQFILSHTLRF